MDLLTTYRAQICEADLLDIAEECDEMRKFCIGIFWDFGV